MCPSGWTLYTPPMDVPYCYYVGTNKVWQPVAEATCEAMGATLASIHSDQENNYVNNKTTFHLKIIFLSGILMGKWAWIGVMRSCPTPRDLACFYNIDGTPVKILHCLVKENNLVRLPSLCSYIWG